MTPVRKASNPLLAPCGRACKLRPVLHAAAFPAAERWGPDAIRLMLEMPGAFGLHLPGTGFVLARVATDEAEILTLAVLPQARRSGQGGRLLDAAAAEAAQQGATALFLEVASDNLAALGLYQSRHFATVGRRPHYYGLNHHATVLRREL